MYESDEVNRLSQEFRYTAYAIINDRSKQIDEANNIGVAPQTLNKWLTDPRADIPASVLPFISCGNIILEKLLSQWRELHGGNELGTDGKLSEIQSLIIEHMGIINSIVRQKITLSSKNEAIDRMNHLSDAVKQMEISLMRLLEGK